MLWKKVSKVSERVETIVSDQKYGPVFAAVFIFGVPSVG